MERYVGLFLFLFSLSAYAVVPASLPQFVVGATPAFPAGMGSITPSGMTGTGGTFTLTAGDANAALVAGDFYPFYGSAPGTPVTSAPYKVSAGLVAYCFSMTQVANGVGQNFQLVSDNSRITYAQSASLTQGGFQSGQAGKYPNYGVLAAGVPQGFPITHKFAGGSYPGIQVVSSSDSCAVELQCFEAAP